MSAEILPELELQDWMQTHKESLSIIPDDGNFNLQV